MLLRIWLISAITLHGLAVPLTACCGPSAETERSCCASSPGTCCTPSDHGDQHTSPAEDCQPTLVCILCQVLCGSLGPDFLPPTNRTDLDNVLTGSGENLPEIPWLRPTLADVGLSPRQLIASAASAHEIRARLCIWLN